MLGSDAVPEQEFQLGGQIPLPTPGTAGHELHDAIVRHRFGRVPAAVRTRQPDLPPDGRVLPEVPGAGLRGLYSPARRTARDWSARPGPRQASPRARILRLESALSQSMPCSISHIRAPNLRARSMAAAGERE